MTSRDRIAESARRARVRRRRGGALPPGAPARIPGAPGRCGAVVLVLATRVRFDTPFGFTVATQLGLRAFAVRAAGGAGRRWPSSLRSGSRRCVDVLARTLLSEPARCSRSATPVFALGPAAVFTLAGDGAGAGGAGAAARRAGRSVRRRLRRLIVRFAIAREAAPRRAAARPLDLRSRRALRASALVVARGHAADPAPSSRCCRCSGFSPSSPASAASASRASRAQQRLPRHRARARRRHRGRRRLHRRALQERRRARARGRRGARHRPRAAAQPRVRRAAARRRQGRHPEGDHQQARQARPPTSGRSSRPTRSRVRRCSTASAASCARSASRPRAPRALGRRRLPGRTGGDAIPLEARIITAATPGTRCAPTAPTARRSPRGRVR